VNWLQVIQLSQANACILTTRISFEEAAVEGPPTPTRERRADWTWLHP
jgi:hypothetical protein